MFSGPQLSLLEMKSLGAMFRGRTLHPGTQVFVTTSHGVKSAARQLGYLAEIEAAGVTVLEGVCFYILQNLSQMRVRNGWTNLISNSAKIVNIIGATHRIVMQSASVSARSSHARDTKSNERGDG